MLKANVSLSRKLSHNFNSDGFSVSLEGEIPFPVNDADGVLEKVRELFDLAQEALNREVERVHADSNFPPMEEQKSPQVSLPSPVPKVSSGPNYNSPARANHSAPPTGSPPPGSGPKEEPASNKQIQFVLNLSRRYQLTTQQLEHRIAQVLGRRCNLYEVTKKEAGLILDQLTHATPAH